MARFLTGGTKTRKAMGFQPGIDGVLKTLQMRTKTLISDLAADPNKIRICIKRVCRWFHLGTTNRFLLFGNSEIE